VDAEIENDMEVFYNLKFCTCPKEQACSHDPPRSLELIQYHIWLFQRTLMKKRSLCPKEHISILESRLLLEDRAK
jgi:hypothetical protein